MLPPNSRREAQVGVRALFWHIDEELNAVSGQVADGYDLNRRYILDFLTAPHPFRKGAVCPFIPTAIKRGTVIFTHVAGDSRWQIVQSAKFCIANYLKEKERFGYTRCAMIINVGGNATDADLVAVQAKLKATAIKSGIMIGALFPHSPAPSLHNSEYFPLRTPYPCLVLRDMVDTDLVFMNQDRHSRFEKVVFLNEFVRRFSGSVRRSARDPVLRAKALRRAILSEIFFEISIIFFLMVSAFMVVNAVLS